MAVSTIVPLPSGRQCLAAVAGLAGAALNLVAVGALFNQHSAYKPGDVPGWLDAAASQPAATTVGAWAFTIGLASLVPFCVGLARRDPGTTAGAALIAVGATLDAAGTLAPVAALHAERSVALSLLWMTLLLDSAFNALLGLGLIAVAIGMASDRWPRGLRPLAAVAGLASLPVALQFQSDTFARLLTVSGPLWVGFVGWAGVAMFGAVKGRE